MKKILIAIGVVVALIVLLLTIIIIKDLNQEKKLRQELNEIDSLINFDQFDYDKVNERLGKTISSGDYLVVEKAAKKYLKDTIDTTLNYVNLVTDEKFSNVLTIKNYQEDGPNFINTKLYIKNTKEQIEDNKNKILNQFNNETVLSYIENKNLDSYYIDFYKSLAFSSEAEITKNKQEIEQNINVVIETLNVYDEVIDFLIENKNEWKIDGEYIIFSTDELSNQYNELLLKL